MIELLIIVKGDLLMSSDRRSLADEYDVYFKIIYLLATFQTIIYFSNGFLILDVAWGRTPLLMYNA
jgi:hypothetical protein